MLSIAKTIKRCAYVCMLSCIIHVSPSWADICFLPTGACEQGSAAKISAKRTCEDYVREGIYYSQKQENMSCSLANIPGCSNLYECTVKSCEASGFKLGPTNKKTILPLGYSSAAWKCESCDQGSKFFWKCTPEPCAPGYVTSKECSDTETFVDPETPTHKSGVEMCGTCVPNAEIQCPEGTESSITPGCYECSHAGNTGYGGSQCYRCKSMGSDYYPEAEFLAVHDSSCYDFKTKRAADGGLCYKGVKITCNEESDQYLSEEEVNGKTLCKCRDYKYTFEVEPQLVSFDAAGGSKEFKVTSLRIGTESEPWDYDISLPACPCSAAKAADKVTITCPPNMSESNVGCAMTLVQTRKDASIDTKTVGIRVYPDSCEVGQLSTACADSKCVAQPNGKTSIAGQTCYNCNNNDCGAGWTPGEAPAPEGYDVKVLESGAKCHKAIEIEPDAETCPAGYSENKQECMAGYREEKTAKSDGTECFKCVSEDCPPGKDCTDDPVCPSGRVCPDKVDCDSKQVGNDTKYFDCKCKPSTINCNDGFVVDEENCNCTSKDCETGYDKGVTSCEEGYKLETSNSKSGDEVCGRCVKETCPSGKTCTPWIQCDDGTNCEPNPDIKCDKIKLGSETMYTDCECKITASSCQEGQVFDKNRCQCRAEDCPVGYDTKVTSCSDGYDFSKSGKSGDKDCGKCTAKTCPTGQTCTDGPICPNGSSCSNNPDVECQNIKLGENNKVTNCRCTLSGTKDGYTLDTGNCKWVKKECPAGTSTDMSEAVCPTGTNGGYHITDTGDKAGDKTCKRCDENTCPSGKTCTPSPVNPGNGGDGTGNPYVNCQKIKLGAKWAYYDCTCKISDQACGSGKKANTTACACETCEGKLQSELNGAMTCEKITCNGQTRYKNCVPWGSQWQTTSNSSCNESKVSDDGRTYFDTSKVCQCDKGSASSNCSGQCTSTQKCVSSGSSTKDGSSCYQCKNDTCPSGQTKDPNDCVSISKTSGTQDPSSMYYTYKAAGTTDAGSTCYTCSSSCTPKACSGYTYTESNFIKSSTSFYEECDPGCGEAKKYKCKDGAVPSEQPNGKTVCVSSGTGGSSTDKKANCDKQYSSSSGWEYLGADYQGSAAAREYMDKYKWPSYHYEIKSCTTGSNTYMYGRKYNTVCNIYNYCNNMSTNRQCYQTTQVSNMESMGYCCATSGSKSDVYGSYGVITSTDEYCCYAGEGCPISRVGNGTVIEAPASKCPSGETEVAKSNMAQYTKACGDSKRVPNCTSPSSTADYVCCTCNARPS